MKPFSSRILASSSRQAIPVLTFPGGQLTGATVREMVHDHRKQAAAQLALRDRFPLFALLSAMDLSAEAEEFGATVRFEDHEIPTVTGRLVCDLPSVDALRIPRVGSKRTRVYLDTIAELARVRGNLPVIAGCIGPFSLAGRLFGVSEALLATAMEPETVELLLEKTTAFLLRYVREFKNAGAEALIMAEPTAGLMSPASVSLFSSPYVRQIIDEVEDDRFQIILHNCGAKIGHLNATLASGATALHFGKPMDLPAAIQAGPAGTVFCGNLDPAEIFVNSTPEEVAARTEALLQATAGAKNFVISSGCDVPAHVSLANLQAFFDTVTRFNAG